MNLSFDKSFARKFKRQIEGFEFEVGVLNEAPHYEAVETKAFEAPQLKTFAGGPARKQTRKPGPLSSSEVLVENMKRLNINILLDPFQRESADIVRFMKEFFKTAFAKKSPKRVENLLQAVVRNPILRQEYGSNSTSTADHKGFNRLLIDTGQMFKAIKAKVKRVRK